jgi:Fic family protein
MDFSVLTQKRDYINENRAYISKDFSDSYEKAFAVEYTHNSTAIEGNTLSLIETKLVLEDKLSIGGKELREIYEVVNHNKAYEYIRARIAEGKPLDMNCVKDIHEILMENIFQGGIYRNVAVRITGASHRPPEPGEMYAQIQNFYADLTYKGQQMNAVELAAWTHAEFVRIHPFADGNGRTSRLLMNYQLMANGFLPVSISKDDRLSYYETLDRYAATGDLVPFADMIARLEDARLTEYVDEIKMRLGQNQGQQML